VLPLILTLFLLPALFASVYYIVLAMVALVASRSSRVPERQPSCTFAILIPAHNEEASLPEALAACRALNYPKSLFRLYVVADNCSDRTAAVARAAGCVCLERHDPSRPGKAAALEWALPEVLRAETDAVLVLDADCRLDRQALRALNNRLLAGQDVIQACYTACNPDDSLVSYVAAVGNHIENRFFYAPRARLGLPALLRGTGMAFRREVLERCPWAEASVVEDVAYTVRIARRGHAVYFAPEIEVASAFPASRRQLTVQRHRWIGGNARLALTAGCRLLWDGFRRLRPRFIDVGLTLFLSVRSLILAHALVTLAVCTLYGLLVDESAPFVGALIAVAGQLAVLAAGACSLGLSRRRWKLLLASLPATAYLLLLGSTAVVRGSKEWQPTPREL
jgi:cellulose synthase/poly-beta-1,6-N-acetylglucosamine synthase-like glycosyltransferase